MARRLNDKARQYCTAINDNPNQLRCNFCGHTMSGITRFKEHLARKQGDVLPCLGCPEEITVQMGQELIQLSFRREEKERKRREELQIMISGITTPSPSSAQARPAAAAETEDELEARERALIEEAIKESLKTFDMKKNKVVKHEDYELESAIQESMRSYRQKRWRRGEGSSRSRGEAGPSSAGNDDSDDDYDSDLGF